MQHTLNPPTFTRALPRQAHRMLTIAAAKGKDSRRQQLTVTSAPDVTSSAPSTIVSTTQQQQSAQGSSSTPLPNRVIDGSSSSSSSGSNGSPSSEGANINSAANTAAPMPQNLGAMIWRRVVRELSSLPRAIGIMAIITALSGLGTVIPQNKPYDYYITNYPVDGSKVLGFLDYNVLLTLQLDHIYSAWYFYACIALLAASLMACTYTTQLPTARVAQRWRFANSPSALKKHGQPQVLPNAALPDLAASLISKSYQVFLQNGQLYAFKGLAGRLGPIGVHVALLMCIAGTAYSGFGGWKGSAMCPEGQEFVVGQAINPASALATVPQGAETVLQVNKFSIDTRPDGSVAQFYSDLTLRDFSGKELLRKTISVNDPFRYGGVTMYQTDWSLAALKLRLVEPDQQQAAAAAAQQVPSSSSTAEKTGQLLDQLQDEAAARQQDEAGPSSSSSSSSSGGGGGGSSSRKAALPQRSFNLPLASLEGRAGVPQGSKLWATFLPLELPSEDGRPPRGISMLARDLDTVTFYDSKGEFVGVRRAGSGKVIPVEGLGIVLEDIIGSTGLEIKSDPGVPLVYAGFGGLMVTTLISYISHSQVWALQEGSNVYVVGSSNRSKVLFERELDDVLDAVPERLPESSAATAVSAAAAAAAAAAATAQGTR